MKFGILALVAAFFALTAPQMALAQEDAAAPVEATEVAGEEPAYVPLKPEDGKGQPIAYEDDPLGSLTFQDQYTANGQYALWFHDWWLLPIITIISIFVLALLIYVMVRFNSRTNPVPSKNTHNTLIEVIWTVVPALILVVVAFPSLTLIARAYETPPEDAITIKTVGYQWYWGYEYPDHGVDIVSNMASEEEAEAAGEPFQLAVNNRMVVPVGVPLRIQTTAADVIHAFAVPSLWFKVDAVPGRLNERMLVIEEPGVYYGQCSELCGALHGYMPIAVEAVPMEDFEAWVVSQGGAIPGAEEVAVEDGSTDDAQDTENTEENEEAEGSEA